MGLFSNIFGRLKKRFVPTYTAKARLGRFDRDVWDYDVTRATIDAIASHAAKGQFRAVRRDKSGRITQVLHNDPMCRLLNLRPNPLMSGTEFKYRMVANLETRTVAVAYIQWDADFMKPLGVYPIDYTTAEIHPVVGGGFAMRFFDCDGVETVLPMEQLIIVRKFYNDRLAGGDGNAPAYGVLDLARASDEGFIQCLTINNKISGILTQKKAMLDPKDIRRSQEEFQQRVTEAVESGGVITLDATEDFKPVNPSTVQVNASQMNAINNRIYTYFRTPEKIVQNAYDETTGLAWHEGKIEPIWKMLAEAVTNAYFTKHEIECGNEIIMSGGVMTGLSMQSITQIIAVTKEIGILTVNEQRELLGYGPVDGGDTREVSLNYVSAEGQDSYQGITKGAQENAEELNLQEP